MGKDRTSEFIAEARRSGDAESDLNQADCFPNSAPPRFRDKMDYSLRRAMMGLTFVARLAGSQQARRAIKARKRGTAR